MPSLRDLKKRLRSVRTTGQLAGAMRTVSTAKYSRVNSMLAGYKDYAAALHELSGEVEGACPQYAHPSHPDSSPVYVLLAGNRGLCGGYNHELFSFFDEKVLKASAAPVVIAAGRKAIEHCRERGVDLYAEFELSDVPQFAEAESLAAVLDTACAEYESDGARFVYQRFINMMKHVPEITEYYPSVTNEAAEAPGDEDTYESGFIFVPDEESIRSRLLPSGNTSMLYDLLLQCALGSHAATLMAMRSAYENAQESALMLETAINRRRQSEVTQGVLETASDSNNYM